MAHRILVKVSQISPVVYYTATFPLRALKTGQVPHLTLSAARTCRSLNSDCFPCAPPFLRKASCAPPLFREAMIWSAMVAVSLFGSMERSSRSWGGWGQRQCTEWEYTYWARAQWFEVCLYLLKIRTPTSWVTLVAQLVECLPRLAEWRVASVVGSIPPGAALYPLK